MTARAAILPPLWLDEEDIPRELRDTDVDPLADGSGCYSIVRPCHDTDRCPPSAPVVDLDVRVPILPPPPVIGET